MNHAGFSSFRARISRKKTKNCLNNNKNNNKKMEHKQKEKEKGGERRKTKLIRGLASLVEKNHDLNN